MVKGTGKLDNILTTLGTNNSSQIATAVLAGFKMLFIPLATLRDKNATPEQKKYTMTRDIITEGLALGTYIGVTGQVQKHATAPICSAYYKAKAKLIEAGKIKPKTALTGDELNFLKKVDYKKLKESGEDFLSQISPKHKVMSQETRQYIAKLDSIVSKVNGTSNDIGVVSIGDFLDNLHKTGIPKEKKGFSVLVNDFKSAAKGSNGLELSNKLFQNTRIALSQVCVWTLALAVIPPLCNAIIAPVMKKLNSKNDVAPANQPVAPVATVASKDKKVMTKRNYQSCMVSVGNGNMRV